MSWIRINCSFLGSDKLDEMGIFPQLHGRHFPGFVLNSNMFMSIQIYYLYKRDCVGLAGRFLIRNGLEANLDIKSVRALSMR